MESRNPLTSKTVGETKETGPVGRELLSISLVMSRLVKNDEPVKTVTDAVITQAPG